MPKFAAVISVDALLLAIDRPDWRVIDARFDLLDPAAGRRAWLAGHVPGAVHADLDKDLAGPITVDSGRHPLPDPEVLAVTLGSWGIGNDSTVVVYDSAGGAIAARAWWLLKWLGHERVALLDGGYAAWLAACGPEESGEAVSKRCHFVPNPRSKWVITTQEVMTELSEANLTLLDARDAGRFRGEIEPIDTRAGHVPGARNLPFAGNLDANGRFKTAPELRSRLMAALGAGGDASWAIMCGSGVTACHLAVAADIAGLRPPRLYAGSWSEWIRDSGRPIAGPG